jgi:hypothetical protein
MSIYYNLSKQLIENEIKPNIELIPTLDFWENKHFNTGKDTQLEKGISILQKKII